MKRKRLRISGMRCTSCASRIEDALKKKPWVYDVKVNFATGKALIDIDEGEYPLLEEIARLGYKAYEDQHGVHAQLEDRYSIIFLVISILLTLPLLIQMTHWLEVPLIFQAILATIVQVVGGWSFYCRAFAALRKKDSNMDVLVVLGTSAAYGYSLCGVIFKLGTDVYFEASAVIISLVLLGQWIEGRCKKNASKALEELWNLQVGTVKLQRGGKELELPIEEVCIDDIVEVRPGDKVPLDGEVLEGESEVDESLLTGESLLVFKQTGSKVIGGSINQQGFLRIRVEHGITEGALAQIVRCVERAQLTKAAPQRLADKITRVFVPIIIGIALLTFIVWFFIGDFREALTYAIAVLVIACPCALGLATPIVLVVATGLGARAGILFRDADALDKAGRLQVLVLDKTGTLTEGCPKVVDVQAIDIKMLLEVLLNLEIYSEHPLARAVVEYAKDCQKHSVDQFKAVPGKGVQGRLEGDWVYAGTRSFLEEQGVVVDGVKGKGTLIHAARNEKYLGYVELNDAVREASGELIKRLLESGIKAVMLTGDRKETAQKISEMLGIEEFFAEVLPAEKAAIVERFQSKGMCVGMVGDGVNDAPALAQADVSFAVRSGSQVAIETAGVTLMHNDLLAILAAIDLSKRTVKKYHQNLFFAFFYNSIGIPLAALGLCNPMLAGAGMVLSSLTVIVNALMLKRWFRSGKNNIKKA